MIISSSNTLVEISPWDVPIWFIMSEIASGRVTLMDYAKWDVKPIISTAGSPEQYKLIDEAQLKTAINTNPSAGEFELMDSLNFMERGDYSGAVRRITTAIEAQTEAALRQELLKRYSPAEVDTRLEQSKNDLVLS
jgi:septin family protein